MVFCDVGEDVELGVGGGVTVAVTDALTVSDVDAVVSCETEPRVLEVGAVVENDCVCRDNVRTSVRVIFVRVLVHPSVSVSDLVVLASFEAVGLRVHVALRWAVADTERDHDSTSV